MTMPSGAAEPADTAESADTERPSDTARTEGKASPAGTADLATARESIVIIGAGFSGLAMAIALKRAGRDDFVILEKAGEVGGTWRENTYPGCACDIMSLLYSYSFAPKADWSRLFPPQAELLEYIKDCTETFDLRRHIRFGVKVTALEFDDPTGTWRLLVEGGSTITARAVVAALGPLHVPNVPDIPGLPDFKGTVFHSAEWDHGYDLSGKRVAVIGTGASAIQFVPRIVPQVESLALFQRTPPWILPKPDRAITEVERWMFRRLPGFQRAYRSGLYLLHESMAAGFQNPRMMEAAGSVARWHLARQVADPDLRRRLTPAYTMGCKRTLLSSDYYPALTQPKVHLVSEGIAEIGADRVITDNGMSYEVDAIILGTGFHVVDAMRDSRIVGEGGVPIQEAWKDGVEAHLGVTVAGFPNLFIMLGPNTGLGHNSMIFMMEAQVRYIMQCLRMLDRSHATRVSVRASAQRRFNRWVQKRSRGAVWESGGCNSWYLDENGKNRAAWPASTINYWWRTRRLHPTDFELEGSSQ